MPRRKKDAAPLNGGTSKYANYIRELKAEILSGKPLRLRSVDDIPLFKERIIQLAQAGPTPEGAADMLGLDVRLLQQWRRDDRDFDQAVRDAVAAGTARLVDRAIERAYNGSDQLMIHLLKMRAETLSGASSAEEEDLSTKSLAELRDIVGRARKLLQGAPANLLIDHDPRVPVNDRNQPKLKL